MSIFNRIMFLAILLLMAVSASAQSNFLEGRHQIGLTVGPWILDEETMIGSGGVEVNAESNGVVGGISYGYWIHENLAVDLSLSVLTAEFKTTINATGVSTNNAVVVPLLVGFKYYLPGSTYGSSWRPYMKVAVGPYIGSESKTEVGLTVVNDSKTKISYGGFAGAGFDILLSNTIMLGISGGYHLASDFTEPIGGRENISGPEFAIGISLLLGKGI